MKTLIACFALAAMVSAPVLIGGSNASASDSLTFSQAYWSTSYDDAWEPILEEKEEGPSIDDVLQAALAPQKQLNGGAIR